MAGDLQPAPAPRYSGTQTAVPQPAPMPGSDSDAVLAALGLSPDECNALRAAGTIA